MAAEPRHPLEGIRVIDASGSYAGPTAAMYLGDLGADVIKVERPRAGDDARHWGPPFVGEDSAWFLSANRNKRSASIDLSTGDGVELLLRLLDGADVFVENLNPGKLESKGLDPETVRARCPRLVYCALSGFGLDGPDRDQPGYDLIAQARSGLMSVTGARGGTPQRVSTALSDIVAGMVATIAIQAALLRRERTGDGELVDVSLLDADLALMAPRIASHLAGEPEPQPSGGTDSVLAIYQPFETADDTIVLAVGNDRMWQRCCDVLDLPELAGDAGLATNAGRRARRAEVVARVAERLATRPAADWLERFAQAGVPCQPVRRLGAVLEDPQVRARAVVGELEGPDGPYRAVRAPWRLGSVGRGRADAAPRLGADTADVLREAGCTPAEIDELLERGIAWTS
ncbi:CaiB/BaiF CoA transferase family protein [Conexibacter woesei]|uniref:L-carnitine dehydratase/bile acid-inducible protein F n=1 Tax=Conexibacter woesei (strain DSM 14684 / CCUG 47730 / CIP 108061 / JCM 11494 / NBRC 100937 / ID131577) TaxID=469383 RepID=D3F6J3_CONWI|nr:CoA transferase [Conexibacter woesei]ADB50760.1 L-carnitine dehydratase/bile acid-inducible protein F [Conexibacter woesei DSM 14684]